MSGTDYHVREDCRLCGARSLQRVLELPNTPLANEFVSIPVARQDEFPLWLAACGDCGHVQLPVVVDPERLFRDYVYVSGTSAVFRNHFRRYAESEIKQANLSLGDFVVEIGSNDGTLLSFFRNAGMRVLGIDPAREVAGRAQYDGIETWPEFFSEEVAERIVHSHGRATHVVANNVFAHADDLSAIVRGIKRLLEPGCDFTFEVSYLPDVLDKTLFDTIYHEHLAFHSIEPLVEFFVRHDMTVANAQKVDTHGGSVRVTVENDAYGSPTENIAELIAHERALGLGPNPKEAFDRFAARIAERRDQLREVIGKLQSEGMRIAGYGAPAKATTLLRTFDIESAICFVVDDSPYKQDKRLPGGLTPVFPSSALACDKSRRPEAVIILAWNFADSILERLAQYRAEGGTVVVPLPEVRVYGPTNT